MGLDQGVFGLDLVQNRFSLWSHSASEVQTRHVLQEPPSEQILLEALRQGPAQSLQSSAHRGEQPVQDLDQLVQDGFGLGLDREQV